MIYRGPGFLAVVKFGAMPTPSPPPFLSAAICFSFSVFMCVAGWAWSQSYDHKEAWPSINFPYSMPLCKKALYIKHTYKSCRKSILNFLKHIFVLISYLLKRLVQKICVYKNVKYFAYQKIYSKLLNAPFPRRKDVCMVM
jgi:hypothetical protein